MRCDHFREAAIYVSKQKQPRSPLSISPICWHLTLLPLFAKNRTPPHHISVYVSSWAQSVGPTPMDMRRYEKYCPDRYTCTLQMRRCGGRFPPL